MRISFLLILIVSINIVVSGQCDTSLPHSRDGSFSPGGQKIAYSSSKDGNQDIYIMNSDGTDQKKLGGTPDADYYPTFTSDGKQILFMSYSGKIAMIHIMNSDGTEMKALSDPLKFNADPRMSPDMSEIIFFSNRDGVDQIYRMDPDGKNQKRITQTESDERTPVWSPDGSKIVFISGRDGNREVYTMNKDGSGQKRITNNPGPDLVASWSPDGGKILFYSKTQSTELDPLEQAEIMTINTDGSNRKNLTLDHFPDLGPSFSPDGQQIVYTSCRGNRELFIMNSDGTNKKQLTFSLDNRSKEIVEIQKVVTQSYIMPLYYHKDIEDMRKGLHKDFNMYVLHENNFEKRSRDQWIEKLYQVKERDLLKRIYTYNFELVDFEGHAAIVKLIVEEENATRYVDYLSLYKFDDGWKILTKLFSSN